MNSFTDHYAALGVPRFSSTGECKAAFRKLSLAYHPDKGGAGGDQVRINEAWEVLKDAEWKALYDRELRRAELHLRASSPSGRAKRGGTTKHAASSPAKPATKRAAAKKRARKGAKRAVAGNKKAATEKAGSKPAPKRTKDTSAKSGFKVGDTVKAKYHGEGRAYYTGIITFNSFTGAHHDVKYDDGREDRALSAEFIRRLDESDSDGEDTTLESDKKEGDCEPGANWACPACTFLNDAHAPECDMCGGGRPMKVSGEDTVVVEILDSDDDTGDDTGASTSGRRKRSTRCSSTESVEASAGTGRRRQKNPRRSKAPPVAPPAKATSASRAVPPLPTIKSEDELRQVMESLWLEDLEQKELLEWLLSVLLQVDPDKTTHFHLNIAHCPLVKVSLEGRTKGRAYFNVTPSTIAALEYDRSFLSSNINYNNGGQNTGSTNCRRTCSRCKGKDECIIIIFIEIHMMVRITNIITAYVADHLKVPVVYFNMGGSQSRRAMKRFNRHDNVHTVLDGMHLSSASGRKPRNYNSVEAQIEKMTEAVEKQSKAYEKICRDVIFPRYKKLGISIPAVPSLLGSLVQSDACPYVGDVNDKATVDAALVVEREYLSALGTLGYERALEVTGLTRSEFGKRGYDAVLKKNGWTRSEFGGVGYRAALEAVNMTPSEFGKHAYRGHVAKVMRTEGVDNARAKTIIGQVGRAGRVDKTMKERGVDRAGAETIIGQEMRRTSINNTKEKYGIDDYALAARVKGKDLYATKRQRKGKSLETMQVVCLACGKEQPVFLDQFRANCINGCYDSPDSNGRCNGRILPAAKYAARLAAGGETGRFSGRCKDYNKYWKRPGVEMPTPCQRAPCAREECTNKQYKNNGWTATLCEKHYYEVPKKERKNYR